MTIDHYDLHQFKPKGYPVRHKRKVPFDPRIESPRDFARRAGRIRELDLELDRFVLSEKDYLDLVIDAYSSNVHWSTKIEGNPLSEAEVRTVTTSTFRGQFDEKAPGPRQEIVNHLVCLVFPEEFHLPWDDELVRRVHRYLLKGVVRGWKPGTYRTERASIQSSEGQELFVPAPPTSVAEEMLSLLDWVNRRAPAYDPVVAATVMFHEFESIHPFGDGNGRVGRSLFHLFLQNSGLHYSHLCKIDRDLLSQGELYYQLLAYTDDTGSYRELVDLVSESVLKSYEDAHRRLSEKDLLSSDLDEAAKRLLRMARRHTAWFSVAEATGWIGSVGEQTVRKRLNQLEEIGALEKKGRTKSCRFRMSRPLAEIRERLQPLRDEALQGR